MANRVPVAKTYKLYINGAFPRTESGRSKAVTDARGRVVAHVCDGSRKDLRDAVDAARTAQAGWASKTAYLRGQILYRIAEMVEGKADELVDAVRATGAKGKSVTPAAARREVTAAIDRLVCFAGWTDKFQPLLGGHNPVAGPYYNISVPEPTGVVGVMPPAQPPLLALVSLIAPPLAAANAVVAVVPHAAALPAMILAEACATADVPAGVVNIITADQRALAEPMAGHRNVDAISAANPPKSVAVTLREGTAENLKRVHIAKRTAAAWLDSTVCESPATIQPFVEIKTIWHTCVG